MQRTRKRTWILGWLIVAALVVPCFGEELFVATDGDDANPGTKAKPLATITAARDAVRGKIAAGLREDVTVRLRGGTYRLTEPVVFGPQDGGTEKFSVTYAAFEEERPVISGGRAITGWKAGHDGTWTAVIPEVKSGNWQFRELFVGPRRAARARHPNEGFFRVEKVGEDRRTNFRYAPGDLRAYADVRSVELVFLHDWSITRVPLKSIDQSTRTLSVMHQVGGPGRWTPMDWFEKQPRYFLENSADFLDAPGEWFLDPKSGMLRYKPREGENMAEIEVIAPVARQLLVVRGDVQKNRPVRNLHFVGLACRHAAWRASGDVYWGRQACTYWTPKSLAAGGSHLEADPAAVGFELAEACSFRDGRIEHVDASGLWFGRGCRGNRIEGTVVTDVGGNGIMIGEGQARKIGNQGWWEAAPEEAAEGNVVANNLIEHCGQEFFGAVGIWVGLAGKTRIAHNEIRHHPYTGVSVGWMWWTPTARPEPRKTPCVANRITDNHIHHVLQTLSDGGGIYCLGTQPNSVLAGNLIHDVAANAGRAESNGMFLDQGCGGYAIEENVIYNIARSPLRFHKGWHNRVRNNVLVVGPDVPPVRYNDTVKERIVLEGNRVVQKVPAAALQAAQRRAGPEAKYRQRLAR